MLTKVESVVHSTAHFQMQKPLGIFTTDVLGGIFFFFFNGECSEVFLRLTLFSPFFCQH